MEGKDLVAHLDGKVYQKISKTCSLRLLNLRHLSKCQSLPTTRGSLIRSLWLQSIGPAGQVSERLVSSAAPHTRPSHHRFPGSLFLKVGQRDHPSHTKQEPEDHRAENAIGGFNSANIISLYQPSLMLSSGGITCPAVHGPMQCMAVL